MKNRIKKVLWAVPGVAKGESKIIRQAEAAIAAVRARVGHLQAFYTVIRQDGHWNKPVRR